MSLFITIYGWIGAFAIVFAYFGNSFKFIKSDTHYQLLNLFGALGVVLASLQNQAYQPATLNIVWVLIGVVSLIKIQANRKHEVQVLD